MTRSRPLRQAAIIGAATAAMIAVVPAWAQAVAPCELHVSAAGYPNRVFKPNAFVKITPPPPGGAVFTTANIAGALDDTGLQALFPNASALKIVRHAELVDLDKRKLDGTRLYASDATCYADLVVDNAYAILTNEIPRERLGLVTGAIVGGNRQVTSFLLQSWAAGAAKAVTYKKKVDSPLSALLADVNAGNGTARADMKKASADSLSQFATFVATKSAK